MNASVIGTAARRVPASISTTLLLRSSLIVASLVAMAVAANFGAPSTRLHDDPGLAQLLRGMASIKAALVVAAAAVVWWRLGEPTTRVAATVYLGSVALMSGATVSIWQLSSMLPAAVVFHIGLFALLLTALRSDEDGRSLLRR